MAIPIANYYEEPRLNLLIPVVGLNTIISGFNSTNLFTLTKKVALAKLVKVDLITQIIGLLVMIIGSWLTHSIWALVAGGLVGTSLKMLISHRLIPGFSNHFAWDKQALEEILRFGKWIFVSTAMAFLASQSDRLVLGKLLSFSMLGVYTIAYTFADLPRQVIKKIGMQVIFPLVSKQIEIPRPNLKAKIAPKRKLMLLGCAILLALSVSFGDLLIIALYDERYISATWMMPILSLGVWPYLLFITINPILLSFGRSVYPAIGNFTSFLIIAFGVPLVFSFTGTLGAIIVIALSDFPVYGIISYGAWQEKILFLKDDIQLTMMFIGLIIILCFLRFLINSDTSIQQLFV